MSNEFDLAMTMASVLPDLNADIYHIDQEVRLLNADLHTQSLERFLRNAREQGIPVTPELTSLIDPSGALQQSLEASAPLGLESLDRDMAYVLIETHMDGIGTEGMVSDAAKTLGKKALRAIGVAVTIGRYKQAVSAALTSLIGIAVGTLMNVVLRDTMTETKIFGTPEQFAKTMTRVKNIVDVVDTMSQLTVNGTPDDASITEFNKGVRAGIRKLITYGVPMSPEGGPRISSATFADPYFNISLNESGWTSEKINAAAEELKSVQTYCDPGLRKPASDLLDLYEGHTTLKAADKMRGRALSRAMRYELMLLRETNRLVKSLQSVIEK